MVRTLTVFLALMTSLLVAFQVSSTFAAECNSCQSCRDKAHQLKQEASSAFDKWKRLKETNEKLMMANGKKQEILRQSRIKLTECEQKVGYPGCDKLKKEHIAHIAEAKNSNDLWQRNNSELGQALKNGDVKRELAEKAQKKADELCRIEKK